ncbi:hypothetical protein HN747_01875 [archaeon]|jgi:hypothetical protein|nr:hypothetical protein [archaeon]
MDKKIIAEIKKKREFSGLPDSLVARFSEKCDGRVKETRALLRKFFGVFLTNKVLKGEGVEILKHHKSSMERDYRAYYSEIFNNIKPIKAVIDLGCGANGFSYELLKDIFGTIDYIGLEAVGQLVDKMNNYFTEENLFNARAAWGDMFDIKNIKQIIQESKKPVCVMLLQSIDAMESLEKNSSKTLLLEIGSLLDKKDSIVISMPIRSISGKKKFEAKRVWLTDFLDEHFNILSEYEIGDEKVIIVQTKN